MTRAELSVIARPASPSVEHPWLVADIGGTNARLALVTAPGHELTAIRVFSTAEHHDLATLVRRYAVDVGVPSPTCAAVAIAGPVLGDLCRTTNASLTFSTSETRRLLDLDYLGVINDLAATALAARAVPSELQQVIGPGQPVPAEPIAVVGVGTGLGIATLAPARSGPPTVLPGEGGHALFAPADDLEIELLLAARKEGRALTGETVVSGPGLRYLYRLVGIVHGSATEPLGSEEISARGCERLDALCTATLAVFCNVLGTVASSAALTTGARGGVYLTGALLMKLADYLPISGFRHRFEHNPAMADYLGHIATVLVNDPYPALRGSAEHLRLAKTVGDWPAGRGYTRRLEFDQRGSGGGV